MEKLLKTKLFSFITDTSANISITEMKFAYDEFVRNSKLIIENEKNWIDAIRSLSYTCIELKSLQSQILYEQGKKCLQKAVLPESNLVSRTRN